VKIKSLKSLNDQVIIIAEKRSSRRKTQRQCTVNGEPRYDLACVVSTGDVEFADKLVQSGNACEWIKC
jgi:hypothetical protein